MDAPQFADLTGTLATAVVVGVGITVVLAVARPASLAGLRAGLAGHGPTLAALIAGTAMAGSLWFSEVAGFPPCTLCWYQRIAMYPLAVLALVAAMRRDGAFRTYGLVLAVTGGAISGYHVLLETFPSLDAGGCDPTNPCTVRWVEGLGFWTIPRMAAAGFLGAGTALWLDRGASRPTAAPTTASTGSTDAPSADVPAPTP